MVETPGLVFGAPGIYSYPRPYPRTVERALSAARMDVCAFVGVAPRGPVRLPKADADLGDHLVEQPAALAAVYPRRRSVAVAVESWDAYQRLYGGFEGPGRLPYAVAAFFEQGGRRAYIVRVVHDYPDAADNLSAVAGGTLPGAQTTSGDLGLQARNEGAWGNDLRASLGFSAVPLTLHGDSDASTLVFYPSDPVAAGALLRLSLPASGGQPPRRELRFADQVRVAGAPESREARLHVTLDPPLDAPPSQVELIEGELEIVDGQGQYEQFARLGLAPLHPRWMAKTLYLESRLVFPDPQWVADRITPLHPDLAPVSPSVDDDSKSARFSGGTDRYEDITFDDFFDTDWTLSDPAPGDGVYALTHLSDLASVVVPDLYVPEPLPEQTEPETIVTLAGATFQPCVDVAPRTTSLATAVPRLNQLYLDPQDAGDLEDITRLQEQLAAFAERLRNFVVLLDVPPGLSPREILRWRARFNSSYLAAYGPWLKATRGEDQRDALVTVNPSAVAAGIIARQEIQYGIPHGPANIIAQGVVKVDDIISPAQHDLLHPQGINIFLQQRDGVWLSAGRTLSRDRRFRQLSVRRLMVMIRRTLARQMQWAVFEPNAPALWTEVSFMLGNFLRRLHTQGAFRGQSESDAFFVRCDAQLNTRQVIDAGKMIAEVGIRPAEPIEFIVLRITRGGDGTLMVAEDGGGAP